MVMSTRSTAGPPHGRSTTSSTMFLLLLLLQTFLMPGVWSQEEQQANGSFLNLSSSESDTTITENNNNVCIDQSNIWVNETHKEEYRIGVLAIRGFEAAYKEFNKTFSDYLTATAGTRFNRPIRFTLVPLNFISLFGDVELAVQTSGQQGVDFIYVNPSAFSCIESEYGANTLVSQISRRVVGGQEYHLTKFGGVIFARADNNQVNTIEDLRDKVIATASISGLGSGQMQFRLLQQKGLSYIQDPKQLVFTSNQGKVVNGVLKGNFDVGFVRTDQLERTKDARTGELVDLNEVKIINGFYPTLEGEPFPFESSTILYPEWNLASLQHVANDVAIEVQKAMLAIQDHATVGAALDACYSTKNCTNPDNIWGGTVACIESCEQEVNPTSIATRCDTTPGLATLALAAKKSGKYAGWRSTLSYMELRNMQEETNFIRKDPVTGINACIRSKKIVAAVVCPPGHIKKPDDQILNGCTDAGLDCGDFQCLCKPCVKAFDVEVFPINAANMVVRGDAANTTTTNGCPKFAICGQVPQASSVVFRAIDNQERDDIEFQVRILREDSTIEYLEVTKSHTENFTYYFEFDATGNKAGIEIFEVFAGDEQIPESPFRLEVTERQCAEEMGDSFMEADEEGNCVCAAGSNNIGGNCVSNAVLIPAIVIPLVLIVAAAVYFYIELKRKQGDSVWEVDPKEIEFDEPPTILGRGTFGLVLLGEYRGTQVAVKRVIPPKLQQKNKAKGNSIQKIGSTLFGLGDATELAEEAHDTQYIMNGNASQDTDEFDIESGPGANAASGQFSNPALASAQFSVASSGNNKAKRGGGNLAKQNSSKMFDFSNLDDSYAGGGATGFESGVMMSSNFGRRASALVPTVERSNSFKVQKPRAVSLLQRSNSDPCLDQSSHTGFAPPPEPATPADVAPEVEVDSFIDDLVAEEEKKSSHGSLGRLSASGSGSLAGIISGAGSGLNSGFNSGSLSLGASKGKRGSFLSRIKNSIVGGETMKREYARLKQDFIEEMRYLSKLRHPCITTVMGAVISRKSEPMLIMEYMDHGSLYDLLHNDSMIVDGELVLPILRDIAQGVRFLHAATPQVIHGDLKAQNVLVDSKFRAKVADFGLSQKSKVGACGTPFWMAPELLRGDNENNSTTDVYSFGIILYEVYSRKDPYDGEDPLKVLRNVANPKINKRPPVPETCPSKVANIMTDCLVGDASRRPSFEELDLRLKRLDVENVEPGQQIFSLQRKKSEKIKAARNEELLFDVFPRHVAEALRDGRKVPAESFECATCFFSDIVSYTKISSSIDAEKVSDMLDRLYLRFDTLSEEHDVFKIDTIGDAYMCVTNLHKDQPDHAERMARFSMDAVRAASETLIDLDDPAKGYVQIRVGFHSGPIVANVVGSRSPKYTLFGDTVNCASRMESNSIAGLIQCSDRTAELILAAGPNVPITCRGKVNIKGKGEMTTYWIDKTPDEKPASAASTTTPPPATPAKKTTRSRSKSPKPTSRSRSPKPSSRSRSKSPKPPSSTRKLTPGTPETAPAREQPLQRRPSDVDC